MKRRQLVIHAPPAKPDPQDHRRCHMTKGLVEIGRVLFTDVVLAIDWHLGQRIWGCAIHITNHRMRRHARSLRQYQTTIHRHKFRRDG